MRASDLPLSYNAVDIVERNLPQRADKTALLTADREVTFGQLQAELNRAGNALRGSGLRQGECVAIALPDSVEWVSAYFGAIKIGAVALSLNTLLTPGEFAYMLRDARARIAIVHESLLRKMADIRGQVPSLRQVVVVGASGGGASDAGTSDGSESGGEQTDGDISWDAWLAEQPGHCAAATTHREDICCLNYSSGTTGEPKGILHAHKDLPLTAALWGVGVLGLTESDRTFAAAKLFFTFGTGGNLIFPFYVGASAVLLAGSPRVAANVLETVDRFKPTILYNAPTGYAMTLAVDGFQEKYDLSSLRLCVSAGEALPAPLWERWKDATGLDIIDGIGSTENYHIFLSNRPGDIRPGSSGKPFSGYELRLVDDDGTDVPAGDVGNLWVKSETASLSYLHCFDRSRATFRGEWLVTGDKYRIDEDGYYWHAGRSDDMLKVGGIWVSPVEVESTLIAHDAVLECAVVGERDQANLVKPTAFVVLTEGQEPGDAMAETLTAHCFANMAGYKRPRRIVFVAELPKTATGKIQRYKLRSEPE